MICRSFRVAAVLCVLEAYTGQAQAQATPGYPERVLQWTVQEGETCAQIATALYGSDQFTSLLTRYNDVHCDYGAKLTTGATLVVPEKITNLPAATLQSLSPEVRARLAGGDWSAASPGMPLHRNDSVNTLQRARADILFTDRTRVVMGEHTLVVIYGTASQSAVRRARPTSVLLEEGELQSAISALRSSNESSVAVKGGGQVEAKSKDTVVRTRNKRTTVSVFDGSARVSSAGGHVDVPLNHGTSFLEAQKPKPARPLPAAPIWSGACSRGTLLAPDGAGVLVAQWEKVPKSKAFRLEVSHEPDFHSWVIREEVPSNINSFRAERMPAGTYFLRVRTIDEEDFLGLASESLSAQIVTLSAEGSQVSLNGAILEVNPYAQVQIAHSDSMQLALDDGPFGPMPSSFDFYALHPRSFRLRDSQAATETQFQVQYRPLRLSAKVIHAPGYSRILVEFSGIPADFISNRIRPKARLALPEPKTFELRASSSAGIWQADIPEHPSAAFVIDVLDGHGAVLTSTEFKERERVPRNVSLQAMHWATGPCSPLAVSLPTTNLSWWAPTSCDAAAASIQLSDVAGDNWSWRAAVHATTMLGPIGLEATASTAATGKSRPGDDAAWLGARWRSIALTSGWSFGPALRIGLPVNGDSPNERLELGLAASWQGSRVTWISDIGERAELFRSLHRLPSPERQYFFLSGLDWLARSWLSTYVVLDAHVLHFNAEPSWKGRAGLTLGLESTNDLFFGWAIRLSPWESLGSRFTVQASVGVRH